MYIQQILNVSVIDKSVCKYTFFTTSNEKSEIANWLAVVISTTNGQYYWVFKEKRKPH